MQRTLAALYARSQQRETLEDRRLTVILKQEESHTHVTIASGTDAPTDRTET